MKNVITGRVVEQIRWTDTLNSIRIEADVPFEAGQFCNIGFTEAALYGQAAKNPDKAVLRPYSFVNKPGQQPLEFYYIKIPDGLVTRLLDKLQAGDDILLRQTASGFLVLSEVPAAEQLWMLATGTAIGPFLSILSEETVWQRFSSIVLAHSVRTLPELTYQPLIQSFVERGEGRLQYIPFASREQADGVQSGRLTDAFATGQLQQVTNLTPTVDNAHFMICGNPAMIDDMVNLLTERGFARNRRRTPGHITVENYWSNTGS